MEAIATRRQATPGFGAVVVIDPASEKVSTHLRTLMHLRCRYRARRVGRLWCRSRKLHRIRTQGGMCSGNYGEDALIRQCTVCPHTTRYSPIEETDHSAFRQFFGNEPARGGCDRGGWQVTLDTVRTAAAASVDCIFRSNVLAIVRWPSLIV